MEPMKLPKPPKPNKVKPSPASAHDLKRIEYRIKRSDNRLVYIERQLNLIIKILLGNPADLQPIADQVRVVSQINAEETTKIKQALQAQKE